MSYTEIPVDKIRYFEKRLASLINEYSLENQSNTPDYILAIYLNKCLQAYNATINLRDRHSDINKS